MPAEGGSHQAYPSKENTVGRLRGSRMKNRNPTAPVPEHSQSDRGGASLAGQIIREDEFATSTTQIIPGLGNLIGLLYGSPGSLRIAGDAEVDPVQKQRASKAAATAIFPMQIKRITAIASLLNERDAKKSLARTNLPRNEVAALSRPNIRSSLLPHPDSGISSSYPPRLKQHRRSTQIVLCCRTWHRAPIVSMSAPRQRP